MAASCLSKISDLEDRVDELENMLNIKHDEEDEESLEETNEGDMNNRFISKGSPEYEAIKEWAALNKFGIL